MTDFIQRRSSPRSAGPVGVQKRADGGETIVGYAAVFYNPAEPGTAFRIWDDVEERIMPGAFDKAVREDDVRGLFNHCPDFVLGRSKSGTLRLSVDARGLRYEIDPPDTQAGRDVLTMLRRGDVSGSSFAFNPRSRTFREVGGLHVVEVNDVALYDVGPVTYPAYPATESAARSGDEREAEEVRAACRTWKRDADELALAAFAMHVNPD
jgi:HK97 family phage prohead protease